MGIGHDHRSGSGATSGRIIWHHSPARRERSGISRAVMGDCRGAVSGSRRACRCLPFVLASRTSERLREMCACACSCVRPVPRDLRRTRALCAPALRHGRTRPIASRACTSDLVCHGPGAPLARRLPTRGPVLESEPACGSPRHLGRLVRRKPTAGNAAAGAWKLAGMRCHRGHVPAWRSQRFAGGRVCDEVGSIDPLASGLRRPARECRWCEERA